MRWIVYEKSNQLQKGSINPGDAFSLASRLLVYPNARLF